MLSGKPVDAEAEKTEQQVVDQNPNAGMKLQGRRVASLRTDTLSPQAHEVTTFPLVITPGKARIIIPDMNTLTPSQHLQVKTMCYFTEVIYLRILVNFNF